MYLYLYLSTFKGTCILLKYFSKNTAMYLYLYFNKCESTCTLLKYFQMYFAPCLVCVCVCLSQGHQCFFIWHLLLINWMGVALVTQCIMNPWQRQSWCHTSHRRRYFNYLAIATRRSTSVIKANKRMCSDTFKWRLPFSSQL